MNKIDKTFRAIEYLIIGIICLLLVLIILLVSTISYADTITEDQAVHCILGEARGEGSNNAERYASLLAHAEAIRNRGHLKGVYGCKASFDSEMGYLRTKGIIALAKQAWRDSRHSKSVKGAQFWGSLIVDKAWIARMERAGYVRTATVGRTAFYRE